MIFICPKCEFQIKTSREKHTNSCNGEGPRRKRKSKGYNPWNKGLNKNNSPKIKEMATEQARKFESGEIVHPWIGRKHKPETIEKLRKRKKTGLSNRSKNEIYFAELCKAKFKNILTNKKMFNGWDADVIILDLKIAILWNGKWHYEKIMESHSLEQVQNRDRIKLKEIKRKDFIPYVIKDMGGFDKKFVEQEFQKFIGGLAHQA